VGGTNFQIISDAPVTVHVEGQPVEGKPVEEEGEKLRSAFRYFFRRLF